MRKCWLPACICMMAFGSLRVSAQDTATMRKATPGTADTVLDKKLMDSIDQELRALFGLETSHFSVGLSYLSNNVYFGRKDTVRIPYLTLSASYYHKSGLYVSLAASWLPESGQDRIDLASAEAGYRFQSKKLEGQASAYFFFFSNQSNNVKADLRESFSFFVGYDLGFIKPVITPIVDVSHQLDFATMLGLEHTFYLLKHKLDITPAINANASTQNYYNSYYRDRKFRIKIKKVPTQVNVNVTGEVLNAAAFKLLDYEFTMPVNLKLKNFTFSFTPVYAIPTNPATVSITRTVSTSNGAISSKTRTGTEKTSNSFFWQLGASLRF